MDRTIHTDHDEHTHNTHTQHTHTHTRKHTHLNTFQPKTLLHASLQQCRYQCSAPKSKLHTEIIGVHLGNIKLFYQSIQLLGWVSRGHLISNVEKSYIITSTTCKTLSWLCTKMEKRRHGECLAARCDAVKAQTRLIINEAAPLIQSLKKWPLMCLHFHIYWNCIEKICYLCCCTHIVQGL